MKQLEIDFRTNFKGTDYNMKMFYKCNALEDIECAKDAIVGYLDTQARLQANAEVNTKGTEQNDNS